MNCSQARQWIDDYHDEELAADLREKVAAHVQKCPDCARELSLLRAEDDRYRRYGAGLQAAMTGESVLWSRTGAGLNAEAVRSPGWIDAIRAAVTPRRLALALVLVVISIAGTVVTIRLLEHRASIPMADSGPAGDLERALRSIEMAEREYQQAIRLLANIVDKRKPTLEPQLVAELERNLKEIDENIAATRKAFREHPSDPEFALYMLAAYAKKVELLQEATS